MDKQALIRKIVAQLDRELELYAKSARAAHEEATHEQSKAENKYDTRGLEASYLARGQSRQAAETGQARAYFDSLAARDFAPGEPADVTALVELELLSAVPGGSGTAAERLVYFLALKAGGTEVSHEGREVLVITPQSPLGQKLPGLKAGETLALTLGGTRNEYRVVSVA